MFTQFGFDYAKVFNLIGKGTLDNVHRMLRLGILVNIMGMPDLVLRKKAASLACDAIGLKFFDAKTIAKLVDPSEDAQQARLRVTKTFMTMIASDFT